MDLFFCLIAKLTSKDVDMGKAKFLGKLKDALSYYVSYEVIDGIVNSIKGLLSDKIPETPFSQYLDACAKAGVPRENAVKCWVEARSNAEWEEC